MKYNDNDLAALKLFNLTPDEVKFISTKGLKNQLRFFIELEPHYEPCPSCGYDKPKINNYVIKSIKHSMLTDRITYVDYKARRYKCPLCGRTYYEHNPFNFKSREISTLTVHKILDDLKDYNETFSSVARRYHISPTTVQSVFDKHVSFPKKPLSKYICMDEVYAFHYVGSNFSSKYVFMMLDYTTQKPIDLLPSRHWDYLCKYFEKIDLEERQEVELVCTDMYHTYKNICEKYLPNARLATDKFHIYQDLHKYMQKVRIRVMKGCRTESCPGKKEETQSDKDNYYLLKKFNWMLFKGEDATDRFNKPLFDSRRKRVDNKHFKRKMNYYDLRKLIRKIPELKEVWDLKDDTDFFFDTNTFETASKNIDKLIFKFLDSSIPEMQTVGNTFATWRKEIINSFLIVSYKHEVDKDTGEVTIHEQHMNNAIIENRNSIIKCIKKNANGYRNWERFRTRVMYVLDPNATYNMYPTYESKALKKSKSD